jgi:15-cis-phytoene synthase
MTPEAYCAQKATPAGSSLYYAVRVLPRAERQALVAVHAFRREIDDVAHEVADPSVARLKLGWWRTEVDAAFGGRPQHPVAQALAGAVSVFDLARARFHAVIDGALADLEQQVYLDAAALEEACRNVCGNIWLLCAEVMSAGDAATRDYGCDLGVALRLTAFIQSMGAELRRGRVPVPHDDLQRFGIAPNDLLRRQSSPGFVALMAHQVARARNRYASALAALPPASRRAQRTGLIMAALGQALLDEIERDGFRVLDRRTALTPAAKAWIAWKTSWVR